jgi:hypothetical protein
MSRDDEMAKAKSTLDQLVAEYNAAKSGVDQFDTFKLLGLQGKIAAAGRRLADLENKEANSGEPLRSAAIYFSSDH